MSRIHRYTGRIGAILAILCCCGCAALLPGALGDVSTLISLGSLGQTAVQVTYAVLEDKKIAVGWLPVQYAGNEDRMIAEAWEQNYQLAKKIFWENEDVPWRELTATVLRKAGHLNVVFALVDKKPLRKVQVREEVAVYTAPSGATTENPANLPGQSFHTEMRLRPATVTVCAYTAFYFVKSAQPTGLLLAQGSWNNPCRSARTYGTRVLAVGKRTPAEAAGLRKGDILTAVNGRPAEYRNIFALFLQGDNVVAVCRGGVVHEKNLRLPLPAGKTVSR